MTGYKAARFFVQGLRRVQVGLFKAHVNVALFASYVHESARERALLKLSARRVSLTQAIINCNRVAEDKVSMALATRDAQVEEIGQQLRANHEARAQIRDEVI